MSNLTEAEAIRVVAEIQADLTLNETKVADTLTNIQAITIRKALMGTLY